jgi:hypothetical protein
VNYQMIVTLWGRAGVFAAATQQAAHNSRAPTGTLPEKPGPE